MTSASVLTVPAVLPTPTTPLISHHVAAGTAPAATTTAKDIRSFVAAKQPMSDIQLAAVVAYYYHFEASPTEQKDSIGKEELIDACRKSERKRPARPEQVLVNTYHAGLLDKAGSAGQYKLNSVGENLVAMVLPDQNSSPTQPPRKAKDSSRKSGTKRRTKRRSTTPKSK